jgi:hypothetical protein
MLQDILILRFSGGAISAVELAMRSAMVSV